MKNILILILFLPFLACNNIIQNKETYLDINCPQVFFSTKDRTYIDNSVSLDNVTIKAELNNFAINEKCQQKQNNAIFSLDVLIIAKPFNDSKESSLFFPIYISLLNYDNEILETQYFSISGLMNKNIDTNTFIETNIIDELKIATKHINTSQLVIGFMIDNKKRKLLN